MTENAIIVSGIPRFLANASSSWNISGDYFLAVGSGFYHAQNNNRVNIDIFDKLKQELSYCSKKFTNINIVNDNFYDHIYNPVLYMLYKWKVSYHSLIPFYNVKKYKRIFIFRPDLYISSQNINLPKFEDKILYSLNDVELRNNRLMMGDVFLAGTIDTFRILADFYDYYIDLNIKELNYHDIHTGLASYITHNQLKLDISLSSMFDFTILRDNSSDMFFNGKLKSEYQFHDLKRMRTKNEN